MLYPPDMSDDEKTALSRGFDHGDYGHAYESQDWESWWEEHEVPYAHRVAPVYLDGCVLGFFSSYSLDEIADYEIRDQVRALRAKHDYDACATCGASLPDDYLREHPYATRVRACPDGCDHEEH